MIQQCNNACGFFQAVGGQEEDMSMIQQAAAELRLAHAIFVAHQEQIPSAHRVLSTVRYALARATLLAGNLEEAQVQYCRRSFCALRCCRTTFFNQSKSNLYSH